MAGLAARQHGLVTRAQALAAGVTSKMITVRLRSGRWLRVAPSVYRLVGTPPTWQSSVLTVVFAAGDEALISHRTAAALWGLEGFERVGLIDVSVPPDGRLGLCGTRVHRSADLHLAQPTWREGIPIAGLARTVLDVAATDPGLALRALDGARRRPHRVPWGAFDACLAAHAGRGRSGIALYRNLIERRRGSEPTDSEFESRVYDLLVGAGLPAPVLQYKVLGYRLDAAWPEPMVGLECHSKEFHFTDEAFEKDPVRAGELGVTGWLILFITWNEVRYHPERVVNRVRRALAARGLPVPR